MKLYFSPGACSLAVHIALREAGLQPELAKVDLMTHALADGGDFHAVNPRGYVPVLELDDGSRHTEVAALLQHIAEQGGPRLPLSTLEWLSFVSSELHKVFSPWLWHKETADSTRKAVKDKLALRFAELDRVFATREWLSPEGHGVADAYAFAILSWAPMLGLGLGAYPQLQAYLRRMRARPAVQAALRAEGLPTA